MGSVLGAVLNAAANAAGSAGHSAGAAAQSGGKVDDNVDKENRNAWRKLMEGAVKENNKAQQEALSNNAPAGVNVSMYTSLAGMQSPEQKAQKAIDDTLGQALVQLLGGGGAQPTQPTAPAQPTEQFAQTPDEINANPSTYTAPPQDTPAANPNATGISSDLVRRAALKKYLGVDVGAHELDAPQWFAEYDKMRKQNIPSQEIISTLAGKFGFIPSSASMLKELPELDRNIIFEKSFSESMQNPEIDAILKSVTPPGVDPKKYKAGAVLEGMMKQGQYIPKEYMKYVEHFRGLEDPAYISNEVKQHLYMTKGIDPIYANPHDFARAKKEVDDDNLLLSLEKSYYETTGRTKAQFEQEIMKPIPAEDRMKYGIGTQYKTSAQLADEGKRFPTEGDRKIYDELKSGRDGMIEMQKLLFDPKEGIFIGVGDSYAARTASKGRLFKDRAVGNARGRAIEYYNDKLAAFARQLLVLSNESGGRFTDVDVKQMLALTADTGKGLVGIPDSEKLARMKYDGFMRETGRRLAELEANVIIKPMGQPSKTTNSTAQSNMLKFELDTSKPGWEEEAKAAIEKMRTESQSITPEQKRARERINKIRGGK